MSAAPRSDRAASAVIASPSYVANLLRAGLVRPKRRLGQNFLVDRNVLSRLVGVLDPAGADVIEIGAGLGALTLALVEAGAARVVAVEKDRFLAAFLAETVSTWPQISLVVADALEVDWRGLAPSDGACPLIGPARAGGSTGGAGPLVAGNLPYAVTTPLLLKLLEPPLFWPRAVVMVQLELAQRLLAGPGSKDYGSLTLAVSAVARAALAFRVGPRSFLPAPEVDTAVLRLERREIPAGGLDGPGLARLAAVVRAAFGQRRKTIANALAAGLNCRREEVAGRLTAVGIDPVRRGETLSLDEFVRLEKIFRDLISRT